MRFPGPWPALAAALTAQTAVSLSEQSLPTITGFIREGLALSAFAAGALVAAIPAGRVLGSYVAGRVVDRVGERTVLVCGAIGAGVLVVAAALSPLAALVLLLMAVGTFASSATPSGAKLVLRSFPGPRRGLAMGIRQAGVPGGGLAAALLLPWLAAALGWRSALVVAGVLTVAGGLAALKLAGVDPRPATTRRLRTEPSASHGRVLRDRDILMLTSWGCVLVSGQYVLIAFLPIYLHDATTATLTTATLFVAIAQVGAIAGRLAWGVLSDRVFHGRRRPLLFSVTLVACLAFGALGALPDGYPLGVFAAATFLGGMSVIGWQGVFIMTIGEIAGPLQAGAATGYALTFISVTIAVAPPLYGFLADVSGSFRTIWIVLAAAMLVALVPGALVREPTRQG